MLRPIPPLILLLSFLLPLLLLLSTTSAADLPKLASELASQPYQYFHSDGVGGSNAVCWLSPHPFPPIEGVNCRFADTISQMKGRQIWQCDGDQAKFCDGCHELERRLSDPKDLVAWKVQGC